ncbi:MAG: BON domain-containing protein [Rhodospirillales bacterium]
MLKPPSAIILGFSVFLALPGMTAQAIELNPFSIIKGAVEAVVEDRSSDDIKKDLGIKVSITADVIDKMGTDVISLSADVYEQDVMLTGVVETAKQRKQIEKLTRAIDGVKKIYNDVLVIKAVDKKKGAVEGFVDDTVIESKINALLLDAKGVNVTNFRWRSVGGRVYLFGRALSKPELSKAVGIVKTIKDVTKVTNRVKIRPKG